MISINYSFHKETSDLDIPLSEGMNDATYLQTLSDTLPKLIENVKPGKLSQLK